VWEDADVLLEALDIQRDDVCLSIASAGDNALSMLSRGPARVIALDLSEAQLACVNLRVAAYRELAHAELLELIGSRPSARRPALYQRCRSSLDAAGRAFWDANETLLASGIGAAGKFERYFRVFRRFVMPLIHSRKTVDRLLRGGSEQERENFYARSWNTLRWRLLFRIFFSRGVMGSLGRDPEFFRYVEGSVSDRILARTRHALTKLDPAANPYLQWILTGTHTTALPHALREENFEAIRANLGNLETRCESVEDFASRDDGVVVTKFNLSDMFEYMSPESYERILRMLVRKSAVSGRFAYWNMLASRHRPESMAAMFRPLDELSSKLHHADKAFFYSAFVIEEVTAIR
jgi:S-adenosylmethionine-diacylglycerol 3-amino-3-carboxypropyl transferase